MSAHLVQAAAVPTLHVVDSHSNQIFVTAKRLRAARGPGAGEASILQGDRSRELVR